MPPTTTTTTTTTPTPQTKEAISAFTATLHNTASSYTTPLVDRAHTLTTNASILDKQHLEVEKATAALARQNDALAKVADEARLGLKEIGDVQNWAEVIERELLILEDLVGGVEGSDLGGEEREEGGMNGGGEGVLGGTIVKGKGKGKDDGVRNGDGHGEGQGQGQGESEGEGGAEAGKATGWLKWW
ncbi:hypothetical protein ASPCADRAFT_1144 [Aspergillus carbonarius ITEM 5010]|uniref:Biogenesis of lysosome-related organelles complex 1 subunit 1 n=1 Tax=Aspergillus carbonarius (strain ITEM 5010) TaxID=602072 RepID=A0A1R3RY95_ASPC5|nr:hypothetical protein ASPCADRAFT_1144 [Aspergillus carbonarius ITEM 5010]